MSINYNPVDEITDEETSGGSTVTVLSRTIEPRSVGQVVLQVIARCDSSNDCASWLKRVSYRRGASGDVDVLAATDVLAADKTLGALLWAVTVDANGDDLRVRLTGATGTTISWHLTMKGPEFTEVDV